VPKNAPPPLCPKCHKAMRFLPRKSSGGRKFQCLDCDGLDPLKNDKATGWLKGELKPPQ
jgi:hypothetical protein